MKTKKCECPEDGYVNCLECDLATTKKTLEEKEKNEKQEEKFNKNFDKETKEWSEVWG